MTQEGIYSLKLMKSRNIPPIMNPKEDEWHGNIMGDPIHVALPSKARFGMSMRDMRQIELLTISGCRRQIVGVLPAVEGECCYLSRGDRFLATMPVNLAMGIEDEHLWVGRPCVDNISHCIVAMSEEGTNTSFYSDFGGIFELLGIPFELISPDMVAILTIDDVPITFYDVYGILGLS